jgi:3-deoxy-D-manno-octulosonic-acid transferase
MMVQGRGVSHPVHDSAFAPREHREAPAPLSGAAARPRGRFPEALANAWKVDAGLPLTVAERAYRVVAAASFRTAALATRALGGTSPGSRARVGELPAAATPLLWLHGASAGEMVAAANLVDLLRGNGYAFAAGFTTTNHAGLEAVARRCAPGDRATLMPWDVPRWIARGLDGWRPIALILVETELWPTLIFEAARRGVPVVCASARIYPRDLRRYRAIRWLMRPTLRRVAAVLAQTETERSRFLSLGAAPKRSFAVGNLKHLSAARSTDAAWSRQSLGIRAAEPVIVCGSLHRDEIRPVFAALSQMRTRARIIVAPRQVSDSEGVVRAAQQRGWEVHRRTHGSAPSGWRVLVLDTVGELAAAYQLATVGIVGGGFGQHGGHNPLEPIAAGVPVLIGEHFAHFQQDAIALTAVTPEAQVTGVEGLTCRLDEWLMDGDARRHVVALQQRVLPDAACIAGAYLSALRPWLTEARA